MVSSAERTGLSSGEAEAVGCVWELQTQVTNTMRYHLLPRRPLGCQGRLALKFTFVLSAGTDPRFPV
jgi:hypothetical protein